MDVGLWSKTDANNANGTSPDYWPEGQLPSTTNDCGRAMMGGAARMFFNGNGSLSTGGGSASCVLSHNVTSSTSGHIGLAVFRFSSGLNAGALFKANPGPGNEQLLNGDGDAVASDEIIANQMGVLVRHSYSPIRGHTLPLNTRRTKLLASGSITSSVASITISGLTGQSVVHVALSGLRVDSAIVPRIRFGNPTIQSGVNDYSYASLNARGATVVGDGTVTDNGMAVSLQPQSLTTGAASLHVVCNGLSDGTQRPSARWKLGMIDVSDRPVHASGHGVFNSQLTANAVQITASGSNFTADSTNPIYYRAWIE